ncbi:phage scaffolding protein [Thermicanus aegyptius]|uniref:phage scaffolding protein n=1 Tax=Thermicanus aegyptius TaxID=94009 RepID=UPI0004291374|nr:phage scaffolding protein [Thermicanus aegyptius]
MDLKELLGEELYNQLMAKLGDKHKVAVVSDGNWIPKDKFNEINEAKKQAEEALKERDKQLSDLKKAAEGNEELKKQIEQLQAENKAAAEKYEAKLQDMAVTTAIKLAVAGQVHDPDLVAALLDKSKIELDDSSNVKAGLDEQIKTLRQSKAFLFVEQKSDKGPQFKGVAPADGRDGGSTGIKNPWSKEHFNLTEQARILRENPELAKQLQSIVGG